MTEADCVDDGSGLGFVPEMNLFLPTCEVQHRI